ncbi:exodeoxyribonuclease VII large subunit [Paracoccus saliphilus]|uniref:Exodeoxyribonuclease 7 large subunit n=1 Tax=Paracoccus saliphilus TaxID=405559 RepID=A0AA46A7B1_9RHOB|nr:exodeoxyribonuclease VII large subunit [Paracoccus saliphilus]WCR04767.1 exodeoxyribonuclease VII large subunit [Paracoccus saliphilus]SIT11083.1 Exodeoxyribonuclease VII large subunit [Paracoccus saliphilus]
MDLIDDTPGNNAHEFTVSELSGAVKRNIEDQFGRVRVRGEIGRVSRPSSGHLYFDLKDDRSILAAVSWKGQAAKLAQRPEEGMEVVATGRMTTFPGQSKYQLIVDQIEPAGMGALMAMLEKRRKALAAEGLFDQERKRALPFLPRVIGVVTSPSGAVIRDILHRLRDRFPTRVLIWPVAVQGEGCAPQVAAAIHGFNDLPEGGTIPRPDLIIVARGGGSLEDLWGFNEEEVVRAAAGSAIPLISAVGHETDTTLIDFASDRRAPTPTAAAELAVPVRADLAARLAEAGARMSRASGQRIERPRQRLRDLSRAMGRPAALTEGARQRLDLWAARLEPALHGLVRARRQQLASRPMPAATLRQFTSSKRHMMDRVVTRLEGSRERQMERRKDRLAQLQERLDSSLRRVAAVTRRAIDTQSERLSGLGARLENGGRRVIRQRREVLMRLDRMRHTLGYEQTLKRGFAVVHGGGSVVTSAAEAGKLTHFEIEFADGRIAAAPGKARPDTGRKKRGGPAQGSLF